jgi:RHS repeat-associated protein
MFETETQRSALASVSRTLYYHQTVGAGATLSTRSDGTVFEERRSEPFGTAIDAYRELDGGGHETVAVDYARDPNNALNKVTDPATGWSDHGARWMVPETGRWLTPDPPVKAPDPKMMTQPWALHPYQYVHQNPVAYWDPDGKQPAPSGTTETIGSIIKSAIGLNRIIMGNGITVTGSKADIQAWNSMLIDTWGRSAAARQLISDIGNDTNKAHAITVNAGRSQTGVLVDSFASNDADLDDLGHFPVAPSAAHPKEVTRGELIVHFLAERRSAILSSNPSNFGPAHADGLVVQNQYRAELGQPAVTSAVAAPTSSGGLIGTMNYSDGSSQATEFNANGDIIKDTKP